MNRLLIPTLSAVLTFLLLCTALPAVAQQADGCDSISRHRKAWEIGVGIHGLQLTRFNVTGFSPGSNGGYRIDTDKRDVLFGGHLYLARELNFHFFLDLQGNADFTADPVRGGKEKRWTAMAGMGLQWRLGEYFHSPYIDPFLCADTSRRYLITGCTDARGSLAYNAALSERRARAVVQALTERGVPAQMLKACGVSKKIAHAAPETSDRVREGDRKILVELITNDEYWDHLPMDN